MMAACARSCGIAHTDPILVGEIMPELHEAGHLAWTVVGFVAGALVVLGLGAHGRHTEGEAEEAKLAQESAHAQARARGIRTTIATKAAVTLPVGMLAAMAVDLLLDGVLIGVGARLGATQGIILTVALTLEILFLGLSVVAEVTEAGASKAPVVAITVAFGLVTAVGAIGGALVLGGVSSTVMAAVLAFGAAALLYLVVEELLVEAHEEKETVWLGAACFLGFLVICVLAALGAE
jgi:ZIP family zinc transporter